MRLPSKQELKQNIRSTLVVQAEVLYLGVGGELGQVLASKILGVPVGEGTLPTDMFGDDNIDEIPIEHLSIYQCVMGLRELLEMRSLGYGPKSEALDSDYIEQEYLNLLELHLSALPEMTFGGYNWGSCARGPLRELLLAGKAWHHLATMIDQGTQGEFEPEALTPTDLSIISDLELRSLRNQVGPSKKLRSVERYQPRKTQVGERGYAAINRFDALDWLVQRKGFAFAPVEKRLFANRLETLDNPINQARAALIVALIRGKTFTALAQDLDVQEEVLRELGDGSEHFELAAKVANFVMNSERG